MNIYLVQHGLSFDKKTDPDRSLTPAGRAAINLVANTVSGARLKIETVYHSGKRRAEQTAEVFAEQLNISQIISADGLEPMDDIEEFVENFELSENIMIVGHLPFMERLTSYLVTGNKDLTVVKFQNAGIVCLQQDEQHNWHIKWTVIPVLD